YCRFFTLSSLRHMIHVLDLSRQVVGRTEAREIAKVVNHVRLVVVAARHGGLSPIDRLRAMQQRHRALKATHAGERLRRQADLVAEQANEAARAQAALLDNVADAPWPALECLKGMTDHALPGPRSAKPARQ